MRSTRLDRGERVVYEEEAIAHWLSQLGEALELISPNLSEARVEAAEAPQTVLDALSRDSPLISLRLYSTVHIQARVTFDETQPTHPKSEGPPEREYWPALLSFYLRNAFEIACLASHLSRPGCLIFDKGYTFIDGQAIEEVEGTFRLQIADSVADLSSTWPTLYRLELIDVLRWLHLI